MIQNGLVVLGCAAVVAFGAIRSGSMNDTADWRGNGGHRDVVASVRPLPGADGAHDTDRPHVAQQEPTCSPTASPGE